LKHIRWSPSREADGQIHKSRDGRFVVIQGSDHFTLLDHGVAIRRDTREDLIKLFAQELVAREELNGK